MAEILGPQKLEHLRRLADGWGGDPGVDFCYDDKDNESSRTAYFEKAWFRSVPIVEYRAQGPRRGSRAGKA